ncbi:lipopolysaccharide biosynthesis protein [Aeromonas sp. 23P]|uniref:lipopolysaccharide biosynthesis protein n=1 Tax=unclassified Aeromonas TaxID=257493 RepID=UPI003F7A76A4
MIELSSIKWVGLSQSIKVITQVASLLILTKYISVNEYGIMAIATAITNFALVIRDIGISSAIIQKKNINEELNNTLFVVSLSVGIGCFIFVSLLSPIISYVYEVKEIIYVLIALALSFPIASITCVQQALLERESKFELVAKIEVFSYVSSFFIALILAVNNVGVYSLVAQVVSISLISSILLIFISPWKPSISFSYSHFKEVVSFTGNVTAFNIVNYISRNFDNLIVGKCFSPTTLGEYSLAYRLMLFPLQSLSVIFTRTLFPKMSRSQGDINECQRLFFDVVFIISAITAPMMMGLFILKDEVVYYFFGESWMAVSPLLTWLAPIGYLQSVVTTTGVAFMALGYARKMRQMGIVGALLFLTSFLIGANFSVSTFVMCYFIANVINFVFVFYFLLDILKSNFKQLFGTIFPSIISSLFMGVGIVVIKTYYPVLHSMIELFGVVILGASAYFIVFMTLFRSRVMYYRKRL